MKNNACLRMVKLSVLASFWLMAHVGLAAVPVPQEVVVLSPPPGNVYGAGDTIRFRLSFSDGPGGPFLPIAVDPAVPLSDITASLRMSPNSPRLAQCIGVSGGRLVFEYTVSGGDYTGNLEFTSDLPVSLPPGKVVYDANEAPNAGHDWDPYDDLLPTFSFPAGFSVETFSVDTSSGATTILVGGSTVWEIDAGGNVPANFPVSISLDPVGFAQVNGVNGPVTVTIPAGSSSATFTLSGVGVHPGVTVRARPTGYPAGVFYDTTLVVDPDPNQRLIVETVSGESDVTYFEDDIASHSWRVRRTGNINQELNVELAVSDAVGGTSISPSPTSMTFFPGDEVIPFTLRARDGDNVAILEATDADPSPAYLPGSATIRVINVDPVITGGSLSSYNPTINQQITGTFSATDVLADNPSLTGTWNWGDGNSTTVGRDPLPNGDFEEATHTYIAPGTYTVTLTVRDKDGGLAQQEFTVEVTPGKIIVVNIIQPGDIQGLANIGSGTVELDPPPPVSSFDGVTLTAQYPDTVNSVVLVAQPFQPGAPDFNSYVFQLIGGGLTENQQRQRGGSQAEVREQVIMEGDVSVDVLFSREWMVGDGVGDIDGDGLSDRWELQWGFDPMNAAGVNGGGGSLTGDRMPNAPEAFLDGNIDPNGDDYVGPFGYPITWSVIWDGYAPTGPIFNNLLHFRGQTLEIGDADSPWNTSNPPFDPTVADTSGDGLTDGWLYYFWANAINDTNFVGRAYNPNNVIDSLEIPNERIRFYFNPRINRALAGMDFDGDGLTVLEEYALGTNPIDWDTDGDGMPDGWEIFHGLDPLDPQDANDNAVRDAAGNILYREWMAADGDGRIHNEVYAHHGFDPRTGYTPNVLNRDLSWGGGAPHTRPFTKYQQYYVMRYMQERDDDINAIPVEEWIYYSTDPNTADTNGDGVADGWALYTGISPFIPRPGEIAHGYLDFDEDGVFPTNLEFSSRAANIYYSSSGTFANPTDSLFPLMNPRWLNKRWPTDPFNPDTDNDQLSDSSQGGLFIYELPGMTLAQMSLLPLPVPGGGLDPTSADTDQDFLPDGWEVAYAGPVAFDPDSGQLVRFGMDGTFDDAYDDYDGDGLLNYQEYLVGTLYHFNYDKWQRGLGYGNYDAGDFFLPVDVGGYGAISREWDLHPRLAPPSRYFYQLAEPRFRPYPVIPLVMAFATTSPIHPDTDGDGMDDYYELFHGLNPIYGVSADPLKNYGDIVGKDPMRPPLVRDAREQPWQIGDQHADPDQDGLTNFEEMIAVNRDDPMSHHTDPTPLWITDMSYSDSFVNLYYQPGDVPYSYWGATPQYMFSFASNEGYDTDNDNIPDKQELIGTDGSGVTDPLNFMSPARRRALYFDGDAAARTQTGFTHGARALRSWTVEMWVRPENTATGQRQILIERPVQYEETDPLPYPELVRRNFRLGFEGDGRLFVEYDNAGNDLLTEPPRVQIDAGYVKNGQWYHVAGVYDGTAKQLRLYVDGFLRGQIGSGVIPANGVIEQEIDQPLFVRFAPIVLGAADANPDGIVHGGFIYYGGNAYLAGSQPNLHSFFAGHIDEVRIWDGARTTDDIANDMDRAFTREDVLEASGANWFIQQFLDEDGDDDGDDNGDDNGDDDDGDDNGDDNGDDVIEENAVADEEIVVYGQILLYHYNFNSVPDPDYEPIVPKGFDALNGRPNDGSYPGIPWWSTAADRSRVYDNYLFVHWMQNTVAHLPRPFPLDSYYWSDQENRFPNSMNPYGHGFSRETRFIDLLGNASITLAWGETWGFSNLLPLRNARTDMSVELWDGKGSGSDFDVIDSNRDGIADWWYLRYGYDPTGPSIAFDDPDQDGLYNYLEYMISQKYAIAMDPNNAYSLDSRFSDFDVFSLSGLTYGELYGHWDEIPAWWKILYMDNAPVTGNSGLRLDRHEALRDPDEDGWSNLAEFRYSYARHGTSQIRHPSPLIGNEVPLPEFFVRLRYTGEEGVGIENLIRENQPVHLEFFPTPERHGLPTGRLTMTTSTVTTNMLTEGWLIEGTNYVFAFMDTDGSGTWSTDWKDNYSEPAGVGVMHVGWDDGAVLDIELTAELKGYWRFGWEPVEGARKYIVSMNEGNTEIFRREIAVAGREDASQSGARNYFHEGDFMAAGIYGLRGVDYLAIIDVEVDYGGEVVLGYHTNMYRTVNDVVGSAAPEIQTASGITFRESRNFIEWKMDPNAVRYEIQIASAADASSVLMTHQGLRPNKNASGVYRAALPFFAGDTGNFNQIWENGVYWYRLRGLSRSGNTSYSPWRSFNLQVDNPEDGGKSVIEGSVHYHGRVRSGYDQNPRYLAGETNLTMIVQAFDNAGFAGDPVGQTQVEVPPPPLINAMGVRTNYVIRGLPPDRYYVRAFIDLNGNRALDFFEPHGMRRNFGFGRGYLPGAIDLTGNVGHRKTGIDVMIRDHDTDNDGLADGWEYSYFGTLDYGPHDDPGNTGTNLLAQYTANFSMNIMFNPTQVNTFSAYASDAEILYLLSNDPYRDSDGDGMSDLNEILFAGTDPYDEDDVLRVYVDRSSMYSVDSEDGSKVFARVSWEGRSGITYVVRSSYDLFVWETRAEYVGSGGELVFEETDPSRRRQFYIIQVKH